jgi:hypothetical protein
VKMPEMSRVHLYREVTNKLNEMGENVLALVRNPNASDGQLAESRRLYSDAYNRWASVRYKLQNKYPGHRYPWSYK